MKTEEIANNLVNWCNKGDYAKCYQELYSPQIVSMEPEGTPNNVSNGMAEVMKKGEWWEENYEVHSSVASGPIVADDWFSVRFEMDTTHKPTGTRKKEAEIGVYQVENGKIVKEQFFYNLPPSE